MSNRNFCNDLLKELKRIYESIVLNKSCTNPKSLWIIIKSVINLNINIASTTKLFYISSPQFSVNDINAHFVVVGRSLAENLRYHLRQRSNPIAISLSIGPFVLLQTDKNEVGNVIDKLKPNSAVGKSLPKFHTYM